MRRLFLLIKLFLALGCLIVILLGVKNLKQNKDGDISSMSQVSGAGLSEIDSSKISFSDNELLESSIEAVVLDEKNEEKQEKRTDNLDKKVSSLEKNQDDSLIKILLNYFKSNEENSLVIDQQIDDYAQGEFGQQWWLAAKVKSKWQVVAAGYSYVNCSDISGFDFPTEMVPDCWDYGKNSLISR